MTHPSSSSVSMSVGEPHAVRTRIVGLVVLAGVGALVAWLIQRAPASSPRPASGEARLIERAPELAPPRASTRPRIQTPSIAPLARTDLVASADPASPSYDPVLVSLTLERTPLELFQLEPRNPAFAIPREQALRDRLTERLRKRIPFKVEVGVSCRTSSCEVTLEGGSSWDEVNAAVYALDFQYLVEASTSGPLDHAPGVERFGTLQILAFTAAQRDHAAYEHELAQHRAHDDDHPDAP